MLNGFHTVDLPAKGGTLLPLIVPGKTLVSGVNDAAGNPFWFNGKVPNVGLNPALLAPPTAKTYNGSKRLDSGVPAPSGPPKPFNVTFTKAGTYKFFCDVHPGMIGTVVVKPAGAAIPSAKQDAKATRRPGDGRRQGRKEGRHDQAAGQHGQPRPVGTRRRGALQRCSRPR